MFPFAPVSTILCSNGGESSDCTLITLRESERETPSFTRLAAAFRLSWVIKFSAPSWSLLPQRAQFDTSANSASNCRVVNCSVAACIIACLAWQQGDLGHSSALLGRLRLRPSIIRQSTTCCQENKFSDKLKLLTCGQTGGYNRLGRLTNYSK